MKGPIQSLEVVYHVHATEDPAKLERALTEILQNQTKAESEVLEGHFGNQIIRVRLHLTGDDASRSFLRLVSLFSSDVKKELSAEIGTLVDEHSALFFRLDKQKLVSGVLALGSSDAVRVKVKPRIFVMKGGAPGFYLQYLEGR